MVIKEARVVLSHSADLVMLFTDLPSPIYGIKQNTILKFDAAWGTGVAYVREHFGLEPKVIGSHEGIAAPQL